MTKSVRVENADTSSFNVVVQVQDKDPEGNWQDVGEPKVLAYPTALETFGITSHRRLIVSEIPS